MQSFNFKIAFILIFTEQYSYRLIFSPCELSTHWEPDMWGDVGVCLYLKSDLSCHPTYYSVSKYAPAEPHFLRANWTQWNSETLNPPGGTSLSDKKKWVTLCESLWDTTCYSPSSPSCFLPPSPLSVSLVLSFSLSVMLSSRPAFCLPLCPPWVSIPNMVILLGPYQLPPSPPLSLSLPAGGSTVQARGWEKETEKHSKKDYGKTWKGKTREARGERKGRMMRGEETEETHSSCVSATNRVVITSSWWRIFCRCTPREQTITSDIFGQYQAVYF